MKMGFIIDGEVIPFNQIPKPGTDQAMLEQLEENFADGNVTYEDYLESREQILREMDEPTRPIDDN